TQRRHHPRLVLAYEQAADQWRYDAAPSPNFFVELTKEQVDAKIHAMHLYGTQSHDHPHTRSDETLRSLATLRGMHAGVPYAEAYHMMRWLACPSRRGAVTQQTGTPEPFCGRVFAKEKQRESPGYGGRRIYRIPFVRLPDVPRPPGHGAR